MSTDLLERERDVIRALGDGTRLAIVERLGQGPLPVGVIAADLPVTRSAVSQHLKVLKDVGLVTDQRVGTRSLYRLDPAGFDHVRHYLDRLWAQALDAFAAAVEHPEEGP